MKRKPNLLIIQTDQQSAWTLSTYGNVVHTPHIDRIGREGVVFTNSFTNSACSTPSRGCFLTGRYPHCHGAYFNDMEMSRDETTLGSLLEENGYDTAYVGKWHLNGSPERIRKSIGDRAAALGIKLSPANAGSFWIPRERSMGFADCRYMFEVSHGKKVIEDEFGNPEKIIQDIGDEKSYTTDWLTDKAVNYIENSKEDPFFLMLSIPDPHNPYSVRPPYDTMYAPENMPLPETCYQEQHPSWLVNDNNRRWLELSEGMSGDNIQRAMAQYCGEVKCIDDNVGKLFAAMERRGILDDTILIFTTDHGDYMGEHGLMAKNAFYETAYRIPLLIRWPEKITSPQYFDRFFSTVDVLPTIAGLLGIDTSGQEQGRDASLLLLGQDREIPWDDEVFSYGTTRNAVAVFTPEYEMVLNNTFEEHLLFDRINDPAQTRNLFSQVDMLPVKRALYKRIMKHVMEVGAPEREWLEKISMQEEFMVSF